MLSRNNSTTTPSFPLLPYPSTDHPILFGADKLLSVDDDLSRLRHRPSNAPDTEPTSKPNCKSDWPLDCYDKHEE